VLPSARPSGAPSCIVDVAVSMAAGVGGAVASVSHDDEPGERSVRGGLFAAEHEIDSGEDELYVVLAKMAGAV
jgi:hypothetical protein